jgi:hypothetical protein
MCNLCELCFCFNNVGTLILSCNIHLDGVLAMYQLHNNTFAANFTNYKLVIAASSIGQSSLIKINDDCTVSTILRVASKQ